MNYAHFYRLGYADACLGKPRGSTALAYRAGYDKGFTELLQREVKAKR